MTGPTNKKREHPGDQDRARESGLGGPAILFDLDGTLVDSVYQHAVAWHEALREEGISYPVWQIHRHVGMAGELFLRVVLRESGVAAGKKRVERLQQRKKKAYSARLPRIRALPGASELLKRLTQLKAPWAIATSGGASEIRPLIKLLGLRSDALIVTGDDVSAAKPEPDIFLLSAQRLHVQLNNCVVVGDSVWDLLAARRAKALGVGLLCGGYGTAELQGAGAYRVYQDPRDLLEHIEELGIQTR
jgi:HAD superfamily hydrolase (TIGR01509 family)